MSSENLGFRLTAKEGVDYDILEDQVVPYCHCTICGEEMEVNEDSPIAFVCGACWIDCQEELYSHLKERPSE